MNNQQGTLKYIEIVPKIWEDLGKIPRLGWKGTSDPETFQERTINCINFIIDNVDNLPEFSEKDILEIIVMLEVADFPATINKEQVFINTSDEKKRYKLKAEKFKRNYEAMFTITKPLSKIGQEIFDDWLCFEKGEDESAIFARQLRKYCTVERALQYQQKGENINAKDFVDYYKIEITHPFLMKKLNKIEEQIKVPQN